MIGKDPVHDIKRTVIEAGTDELGSVGSIDLVAKSYEEGTHCHRQHQIMLVERGLVTFDVGPDRWLVPPHCVLWVPARMEHSMRGIGEIDLHCVYLEAEQIEAPFAECRTIGVSPLLRELIIEMSKLPGRIDADGPYTRLIRTMIEQLSLAPEGPVRLPMPAHARLREIVHCWLADPADRTTIAQWAKRVGMSQRTLHRTLLKETGMSFGRWRRHLHVILALQRLAEGHSVQEIAYYLGYDSPSTFVVMFRKAVGQPPLRFLAEVGKSPAAEYWAHWRSQAADAAALSPA